MTPLQHAAFRGKKDVCQLLLARGADVNSNYHDNSYSTLMFAALSGMLSGFHRVNENNKSFVTCYLKMYHCLFAIIKSCNVVIIIIIIIFFLML